MTTFSDIREQLKKEPTKKVVLCGAEDKEGLVSLKEAFENKIARPVLIGNQERIQNLMQEIDFPDCEIIHSESEEDCAYQSVQVVRNGKADILLKGLVKTSVLLKAVLQKETGIKKEELLSHVLVTEIKSFNRWILITDGGMIIRPTLEEKVSIIKNAVFVAKKLGIDNPKIACICAVETVNTSMPETLEAAILCKMNQRGQIRDCIVEGPVGLDIALDSYAARVKKIKSEVGGKADVLLVPDIHSGNFLGKSAEYFGANAIAGVVVGAKVPILIVSRSDKAESKFNSILLGALLSQGG